MRVHPTAIVHDGAELGEDVEIGPFCSIGPRVRLGARTRLIGHCTVDGDTVLGEDCEVFPFTAIGMRAQDKKILPKDTSGRLVIGSRNIFRESVTIHTGTPFGGGVTIIGDDCMFLATSHVGHDSKVGNRVIFTNGAMIAGHSLVSDRAILGAMVGLHQFARIGELAMIGAGAMVARDAPPFALVQGDRARIIGVNLIGMKRANYTEEQITAVKRLYRMLFWRSNPFGERVALARATFPREPLVQHVLKFVSESKRGICVARGRFEAEMSEELAEN